MITAISLFKYRHRKYMSLQQELVIGEVEPGSPMNAMETIIRGASLRGTRVAGSRS